MARTLEVERNVGAEVGEGGYIDVHAHLDSARLGSPLEAVLERARLAEVSAVIMAGVDAEGWAAQLRLIGAYGDKYLKLFPVFGVHPQRVAQLDPVAVARELTLLEAGMSNGRPVALGEIGLDRLTPARRAAFELQEEAFRVQLHLAQQHDLPVVLHLLRADSEAVRLLRDVGLPPAGGVVHSFSGALPFARALVDLGLHLSFSGTLTYPQSRRLREVAAFVPQDRVLIESDTPDQAAAPYRGGPSEPAHVVAVAQALAELRGCSLAAIARTTSHNARRLFRITM